jgi:predicted Zn finger-like uncharacterized protein
MRIVCPMCSANYEVRDALLAPGRAVRCTRCGEQWMPIKAARPDPTEAPRERYVPPPPDEYATPPPPLTAMERLASRPPPLPQPSPALRAAWAASLVVVVLCGWGVIALRADLMRAWPPSTRLYEAIGLLPAPPMTAPSSTAHR